MVLLRADIQTDGILHVVGKDSQKANALVSENICSERLLMIDKKGVGYVCLAHARLPALVSMSGGWEEFPSYSSRYVAVHPGASSTRTCLSKTPAGRQGVIRS